MTPDIALAGRHSPLRRAVILAGGLVLLVVGLLVGRGAQAAAAGYARPNAGPDSGPPRPAIQRPLASTTTTPSPTATPPCAVGFADVTSPNVGASVNYLYGVAAPTANDAWAVGAAYDGGMAALQTLIERWNGTAWAVVPSPNSGTNGNVLQGVSALGANDAWAAGSYDSGTAKRTLIEHWDGTAWTIVPSPNNGTGHNVLLGISALAANNVWATGYYVNTSGVQQTLVLHWDGSAWTVVPSPNNGTNLSVLQSMVVVAANEVWAAGYTADNTGLLRTLIERWNGSAWAIVSSPNAGTGNNALQSIAAGAGNALWAVGSYNDSGAPTPGTLTLRWDGTTWTIVPSPNNGTNGNVLQGVSVLAPNDAWAVGFYKNGSSVHQSLLLHWDGAAWSQVTTTNLGTGYNHFYAVAAQATANIWVVGDYDSPAPVSRTRIGRIAGQCPSATPTRVVSSTPTPSPSRTATSPPTQTPGGPSATPVPSNTPIPSNTPTRTAIAPTITPGGPSATPTQTATVCPIQFTDVPSGSPFYVFVRCLACRGVVSGYQCGGPGEPCPGVYYRPGADLTRGQLSKIIANAAGVADPIPTTQQTFEDVPVSQPFWLWVERLAGRGAISGYSCGGAGEPCVPPGNRPYFRPANNATRGQIAKIDAVAAGYADVIPTTQQTFEDVPPTQPFWFWIEELAGRTIINGYTCGGAGEPCVPPQNRPYFRPGANTTRGQMAKIAANTFYPNCQTPAR